MATLPTQTVTRGGLTVAFTPCTSGGDSFTPGDSVYLVFSNVGAALTINVTTPGNQRGIALAGLPGSIPAGAAGAPVVREFGPFPASLFADPATRLAAVTYTGSVAGLSVAAKNHSSS